MMNVRELAEKYEPYIIERRRFYHTIPELSNEEFQTTAAICDDLKQMGIEPVPFEGMTGLTALIRGTQNGPTVALRADIDGLNTEEATGLPFASKNGKMHACGHDAHIAMQLGAAKILQDLRGELKGNVLLLFQPAEESANGAADVLKTGVLKQADAIYGTHVWGMFDAPLIDVTPGYHMAANFRFKVVIHGVAAHGSAPHLGKDALTAACSAIMNLQMLATRLNDATKPFVLTVGTIHGGTQYNSIADEVVFEGSVRHYREDGDSVDAEIDQILRGTCAALGVTYELECRHVTIPINNKHDDLNRIAHDAVVKLYGESAIGHLPAMMSSEDYSLFTRETPAIFTYIGSRNEAKGITASNHQNTYTVDEDILKRGSALAAQFALDYCAEKAA